MTRVVPSPRLERIIRRAATRAERVDRALARAAEDERSIELVLARGFSAEQASLLRSLLSGLRDAYLEAMAPSDALWAWVGKVRAWLDRTTGGAHLVLERQVRLVWARAVEMTSRRMHGRR